MPARRRTRNTRFARPPAHVQSERLALAQLPIEAPIGKGTAEELQLTLERTVLNLRPGQFLALTGERADLPGVKASEIVTLKEIQHSGGFTTLFFESPGPDAVLHPRHGRAQRQRGAGDARRDGGRGARQRGRRGAHFSASRSNGRLSPTPPRPLKAACRIRCRSASIACCGPNRLSRSIRGLRARATSSASPTTERRA